VNPVPGSTGRRVIALVVNPVAGRGRAQRISRLVAGVLDHYADVRVFDAGRSPAGSLAAVRQAVAEGVDAVAVCGGDGIVHLAANVLAGGGSRSGSSRPVPGTTSPTCSGSRRIRLARRARSGRPWLPDPSSASTWAGVAGRRCSPARTARSSG